MEWRGTDRDMTTQTPRISSTTWPVWKRCATGAGGAAPSHPTANLDDVISAFQQDIYVLERLETALADHRFDPSATDLFAQAKRLCAQLQTGCELNAAQTALMHDSPQRADNLLAEIINQQDPDLPDPWRPFAVHVLAACAWVHPGFDQAIQLLHAAQRINTDPAQSRYLSNLEKVLRARECSRSGDSGAAIRACNMLIQDHGADVSIKILAYEMIADAFGRLGDTEREQAALEAWAQLFSDRPNGPCDEAATLEHSPAPSGVVNAPRCEEILERYSRLAAFYEADPTVRPQAERIYRHFLNMGYHGWVDPGIPHANTIEKRMARLAADDTTPSGAHIQQIDLIEPERAYGRVTESAIDQTLQQLCAIHPNRFAGVVLKEAGLRQNQFAYTPYGKNYLTELEKILVETACSIEGDLHFEARIVEVWTNSHTEQWVLLHHNQKTRELKHCAFGLKSSLLGHRLLVSPVTLLLFSPLVDSAQRQLVKEYLGRKPEDLPEMEALQNKAIDLITRAGRRLENACQPVAETSINQKDCEPS